MKSKNTSANFTPDEYKEYLAKSVDYSQYKKQMGENLALSSDLKLQGFINLNQRRMHHVEMNYSISEALALLVKNIKQKIYWLVVTEHWCGDSSQSLPVFNKVAALSDGKVEMRIVYRDQYPELLNVTITTLTRMIPKIIQLDSGYHVTDTWGPRPSGALQLMEKIRSDHSTAASHDKVLHAWYANDKQLSIESEIAQLLDKAKLNHAVHS